MNWITSLNTKAHVDKRLNGLLVVFLFGVGAVDLKATVERSELLVIINQ